MKVEIVTGSDNTGTLTETVNLIKGIPIVQARTLNVY